MALAPVGFQDLSWPSCHMLNLPLKRTISSVFLIVLVIALLISVKVANGIVKPIRSILGNAPTDAG